MHAQSTVDANARRVVDFVAGVLERTCNFGTCRQPAARVLVLPTPIGRRVELLCDAHAQRRHELEQVLVDEALLPGSAAAGQHCEIQPRGRRRELEPIPYVLTDTGRADLVS